MSSMVLNTFSEAVGLHQRGCNAVVGGSVDIMMMLVDVVDGGGGTGVAGEGEGLGVPSSCEKDGTEGFLPTVVT